MISLSKDSSISLIDQLVISGSNLILGFVMVRMGALELYGEFALWSVGILFALSIHQALLLTPMMSIGPKLTAEEKPTYYRSTFSLQVAFSLLAAAVSLLVFLLSPLFETAMPFSFTWALAAMLLQVYFRRLHYQQQQARQALVSDAIAYGGWLLLVFLSGFKGNLSIHLIFWQGALSFALASCYSLFLLGKSGFFKEKGNGLAIWPRHWKQARWLAGAALLQFFSGNYFLLAAASLLGPGAAGAVRMAQSLMGGIHVLFLAMENVVPVRAAAAWARDGGKGLQTYLLSSSLKPGLALLAILAFLALLGPQVLTLAYGTEGAEAFSLILPFCLLYLVIFPGYPLRFALRALETTQPMLWAYVLSAAFSLLVANHFVAFWGLAGVAYGMMGAQLIMQLIYSVSLTRINIKNYPAL